MKKILALVLLLVMVLSIAACGNAAQTPAEKPAEEQPAEQPAEEEAVALPELSKEAVTFEAPSAAAGGPTVNSDAVRAGDGEDFIPDFSKVPPTNDKAAYLNDGRLQLDSGNIRIIFTIPMGWMVFTQDAMNQQQDYALIRDPGALVTAMQQNDLNAVILTSDEEELHCTVRVSNLSMALGDMSVLDDRTADYLAGQVLQATSGATDVYFIRNGSTVYMVIEFGNEGVLFVTVCNSTEILFSYTLSSSTTDKQIQAVLSFLSKIEFSGI